MTTTDPATGPLSLTAAGLAPDDDVMPCGCVRTRLIHDDDPEPVPLAEVARSLRERVLAALEVRE